MKLLDKLNCALGNHKHKAADTAVTGVWGDVCRIEVKCCVCGRRDCFLTTFTALDEAADEAYRQTMEE